MMVLRESSLSIVPRAGGVVTSRFFGRFTNASGSRRRRNRLDVTALSPQRGVVVAAAAAGGDASRFSSLCSPPKLLDEVTSVVVATGTTSRLAVTAGLIQVRRPLCAPSGGDDREPPENGSPDGGGAAPLDVYVSHVHGSPVEVTGGYGGDEADGGQGRGRGTLTMEKGTKPIRAKGVSDPEPTTVRFLDVPGSEETRAEKMTIVFTCTVCDTRTAKTFAKLSYDKGVVVARCPGCHNLHLIADRLGWFEEAGDPSGGWDIQKITNRIGEADCHVVNEDNVMELTLVDIAGKSSSNPSPATRGGGGGGAASSTSD